MSKHKYDQNRIRHISQDQPMPVACNARSYARFSRWLEGELAKLERRWRHMAAPAARRPHTHETLRSSCIPFMPKPKPK